MKRHLLRALLLLSSVVIAGLPAPLGAADAAAPQAGPIRVLVITGGHDYETNRFLQLFKDTAGLSVQTAAHPAAQDWLKPDKAKDWDVLVLYDLWQDITEAEKADFLARLKEGKGLLALHHSLADYQNWPEFERIIGGRYNLAKRTVNGVEKPASIYQHGLHFRVRVANPQHPVTQGVTDFDIEDETYGLFDVSAQVHALLTTDEPTSTKTIGWARTYEAARVVYLQSGHDHTAYDNPNYRRLVANAIRWVAKRD